MAKKCSQCGATFTSSETCIDRFNITQAKELENPASYGAVHHLSVPCYMLQHNTYSRQGWLAVRQLLHQFVYEDLTPAEARQKNRGTMDSGKRTWSLTKGVKLAPVDEVTWTCTISDVRFDTAEHYCADVRDWSVAVLADTEALRQAYGSGT